MRTMQRDYLFFTDDRGGIPTSSMHLADRIAKEHRVFWVNIYTRLPKFTGKEFSKALRILTKSVSRTDKPSKILEITPLQFPVFTFPFRQLNGYFEAKTFRKLVQHYDIHNPVLITNFPCAADAFRKIRSQQNTLVYYCVDDYLNLPGLHRKHWKQMEDDLMKTVDGAVFTSRDLIQKKALPHVPQLYLPHGVDYELFSTASGSIDRLEVLPKPIIGFFGALAPKWFDVETFVYLAKRFPQYSIVVIGPSEIPLDCFNGIANLHHIGRVPYDVLPQYARYFTAALMPFFVNDLTLAANPLKLMEYYAIGVPVVSTPLPDIADVPGPLFFANTHEEFGNQLETILNSGNLSRMKTEAQEIARHNSWTAKAEELMRFIEGL